MNSRPKVLVIGSKHARGDKYLDWKSADDPYLPEYDLIIVNPHTLPDPLPVAAIRTMNRVRAGLNEALKAKSVVMCVTVPDRHISCSDPNTAGDSNYAWSPIRPMFKRATGQRFEETPKGLLTGYYRHVKRWSHYLTGTSMSGWKPQKYATGRVDIDSSLCNYAGKPLAFSAKVVEYHQGDEIDSQQTLFFPPPTDVDVSKGIDIILDLLLDEVDSSELVLPPWTEAIAVGREHELRELAVAKQEEVTKAQHELDRAREELARQTRFKGLLTEGGEQPSGGRLEALVHEAFVLLGVDVETGPKFKEDKRITDAAAEVSIPVEITGRDAASISEAKLRQLIARLHEGTPSLGSRGILVGNGYRTIPLDSTMAGRRPTFEPDVVAKAKAFDLGLLPSTELLRAVHAALKGEDTDRFVSSLFTATGLISFDRD